MMDEEELQEEADLIEVVDKDTLNVRTDQGVVTVRREDRIEGHPFSGIAFYAGIMGDHRMIGRIYDDCQTVFEEMEP